MQCATMIVFAKEGFMAKGMDRKKEVKKPKKDKKK